MVSVTVDRITAQGLNAGREGLDDVLVLRVENAHDIFVPVHAEYCRSCYGMPLEELVVTMQPVRQTALPAHRSRLDLPADDENPEQRGQETATSLTDQSRAKAEKRLGVPKEMWRLVDALWSGQALRERDLFVGVADPAEVNFTLLISQSARFPHHYHLSNRLLSARQRPLRREGHTCARGY